MNITEWNILNILRSHRYENQRSLAEESGYSVGAVNNALKELGAQGYLDTDKQLTDKALDTFRENRPRRAVILAAGFGMRMVPINVQYPKALIEVHGQPLIERQIEQLKQVGVDEIYVVVGFMKEQFEYLIDKYGITLLVNPDYATKNNLHSLALASEHLEHCYIVPCDIYCPQNPFSHNELYSWYMLSDEKSTDSHVRINRKGEIVNQPEPNAGNTMIGISYLLPEQAARVRERLQQMDNDPHYANSFWEETLCENDRMLLPARLVCTEQAIEINTYEQLRELDSDSRQLNTDTIRVVSAALNVKPNDITNIQILKKGMTNRSFTFDCKGNRYIMRIPGEGTDQLINRAEEASVYRALSGQGVCENVLYINPDNGYKITEFFENSRVCNPDDPTDVKRCMDFLRAFHERKLKVSHFFDIFEKIDFYQSLWNGQPSAYRDYEQTKANVLSLRSLIESAVDGHCLTHIDAVPDNFLFHPDINGDETVCLIDWEYAAMQDPHVDIAMFAIYAMYEREQVEALIDAYFENNCSAAVRKKIYAYIAACGLLWSNWCEYKRQLGVEFGEYSLAQYRYAKTYYKIALED